MITIVKVKLAPDDPLLRAAEGMEPAIRAAFLAAIRDVKSKADVEALARAVESGDANKVFEALDFDDRLTNALSGAGLPASVGSVKNALQSTFASGAEAALSKMPTEFSTSIAFDLFNPKTVEFLQSYTFDLIRGITQTSKDAIQQTLIDAFQNGGHPRETAREIVGYIGLTPNQQRAVSNYRAALESGSSSDLRGALSRALRDGRYDRALLRALDNQTAVPQSTIDKMVERYEERYLKHRATNIARTESLRAANKGQRALWSQAREQGLLDDDALREWETSGDERTCDFCDSLDGAQVGLDEEFAPGVMDPPDPHPDCILGDTFCVGDDIAAASERFFDGLVIVLRTASGRRLACTSNHPILTERGWAPAHLLDVSGYVVCSADEIWRKAFGAGVGIDVEHENMPSRIQEIAEALRSTRGVLTSKMPTSREDFHGDGIDGKIAVVYSKRFLRNTVQLSLIEQVFQKAFERTTASARRVGFAGFRAFFERASFISRSASRGKSSFSQLSTLAFAGLSHPEIHRLAEISLVYSRVTQPRSNSRSGDGEELGEFFNRPTGSVFLDKIVQRDIVSFRGQVYNLQTATHEYVANGIITHNCRCTTKLVASSFKKRFYRVA